MSRFDSPEVGDEEIITEKPRKARGGQRQRRISRNNDGEPLIEFGSTVIEAEITGNPEAAKLEAQYAERLAARNPNYRPMEKPER